jgi:hypothetical protein
MGYSSGYVMGREKLIRPVVRIKKIITFPEL